MLQPTVTYDLYHIYTITDVCITLCGTDSLWFHGVSASVHTARSTQRRFFFSQFCVEELDRPAKNHDFNPIQPWPD